MSNLRPIDSWARARTRTRLAIATVVLAACSSGGRGPHGDAGAGDDSGVSRADGAAAGDMASAMGKRVFVTSTLYYGNLQTTIGGVGNGISDGDAACNLAAQAANLGGTWVAWLSTSTVNAVDRVSGNGPWSLVDGTKVFHNAAGLRLAALAPIDVDENGMKVDGVNGEPSVYTGTAFGGTVENKLGTDWTCGDWSATGPSDPGEKGDSRSTTTWTESSMGGGCGARLHLYCFEL